MRYTFLAIIFLLFSSVLPAVADDAVPADKADDVDKVIITATRIETPVEDIASDVTIIDSAEIKRSQKNTVAELLRSVGGIDVVRNGGPGSTTSVFIRGAKSEHTLVMIDGVEMNDPISAGRGFDFASLTVDAKPLPAILKILFSSFSISKTVFPSIKELICDK